MPRLTLASPFGRLGLLEEEGALRSLVWGGADDGAPTALLIEARRQLAAYFAGRLKRFRLPLAPAGSPTELRVWQLMAEIPFGETRCYGDLATPLGLPPRAVGRACGRNPLPILIPCHRVVAAGGGLGGYSGAGGIETKRRLLLLERALLL